MNKHIDPFLANAPFIDLHGESRDSVSFLINDFINDNIKLKKRTIVIIHGKGRYVLKEFIHNYLKKDKRVDKYYLDINTGQTVVELKKNG